MSTILFIYLFIYLICLLKYLFIHFFCLCSSNVFLYHCLIKLIINTELYFPSQTFITMFQGLWLVTALRCAQSINIPTSLRRFQI